MVLDSKYKFHRKVRGPFNCIFFKVFYNNLYLDLSEIQISIFLYQFIKIAVIKVKLKHLLPSTV